MSSRRGRRRRARAAVTIAAAAGAALGLLIALRALELHDLGEALDVLNVRTGRHPGTWALGFAGMGLAAAAAFAAGRLAWSASLAAVAGMGGFLAVGGLWLLPGALLLAAGFAGFVLVDTPRPAAGGDDA